MRRSHFEAFAPSCPRCLRSGETAQPLVLATLLRASSDGADILDAVLQCPRPACRHEYPVVDGLPIIVPELRRLLTDRGIELFLRADLDATIESMIGDALGPGSWLDAHRQALSAYGWDGYAEFDPAEAQEGLRFAAPGSAVRCAERLQALAGTPSGVTRAIDIGCGAGRTAFLMAERHPAALVLGFDVHLGLLRLARSALQGRVRYPRRRVGLVYDTREFPVRTAADPGRVDFWACDALALPFAPGTVDLGLCLNVLDAVSDPSGLLRAAAAALRPGGQLLLATPFDWSERVTQIEGWIGGHSQRTEDRGDAVARLHAMLDGQLPLRIVAEELNWPWQMRLHDRAAMQYRAYLLALKRAAD